MCGTATNKKSSYFIDVLTSIYLFDFFFFFDSYSALCLPALCLPFVNLVAGIAGLPVFSSMSVFACSNGVSWHGSLVWLESEPMDPFTQHFPGECP